MAIHFCHLQNKWMIYFQGGGWCYSVADCIGRSKGNLGSSSKWAPTGSMAGMLSADNATNPYFAGWTKVISPLMHG